MRYKEENIKFPPLIFDIVFFPLCKYVVIGSKTHGTIFQLQRQKWQISFFEYHFDVCYRLFHTFWEEIVVFVWEKFAQNMFRGKKHDQMHVMRMVSNKSMNEWMNEGMNEGMNGMYFDLICKYRSISKVNTVAYIHAVHAN